jgi:hypothetical protein
MCRLSSLLLKILWSFKIYFLLLLILTFLFNYIMIITLELRWKGIQDRGLAPSASLGIFAIRIQRHLRGLFCSQDPFIGSSWHEKARHFPILEHLKLFSKLIRSLSKLLSMRSFNHTKTWVRLLFLINCFLWFICIWINCSIRLCIVR